jgi:hypothetical protein
MPEIQLQGIQKYLYPLPAMDCVINYPRYFGIMQLFYSGVNYENRWPTKQFRIKTPVVSALASDNCGLCKRLDV